MSTSSPLQNLPIPESTDAANAPAQISALAQAAEKKLVMTFASESARDAAITSPVQGMTCFITGADIYTTRIGSAWIKWSPEAPRCIAARQVAAFIAAATNTPVTFTHELMDTHEMFTPSSQDITIVKPGYYDLIFNGVWLGNSAEGVGESHLQVNGEVIRMGGAWATFLAGGPATNLIYCPDIYLTGGETVGAYVRSSTAKTFAGANVEFCNLAVTYKGP